MIPLVLFAAFALAAQDTGSPALQGLVLNAEGKPLAAASVQVTVGSFTLLTKTDFEGRYRLNSLRPGPYTIHAQADALIADVNITLGEHESRTLDLTLAPKPAFFDPPSFIVAGVTDGSQRGGHGSDPGLHSSEALSKAAAALGSTQPKDDPLAAVRDAERAAEQDPTETHLFDWGAELLTHRAAQQSDEVFTRGAALFPHSTRMLLGLAVASYSHADYDRAERYFFEAADLNPADPKPYLFLGQARNSPVGKSAGFNERMHRFARLQPNNAWANYYYALTAPDKAETLLRKAVELDSHLTEAWLQLGVVLADHGDLTQAIAAWQKAGAKAEAHYRLARAYRQIGDQPKAKAELDVYEKLSKEATAEEERDRANIQEFVFTLRDAHQ